MWSDNLLDEWERVIVRELPATVLAVAQYDPLHDHGTAYAEALRAVPVPVTLHPGLGLIHGCFDMLGVSAAARSEMHRVLRSVRETLADASVDDADPGQVAMSDTERPLLCCREGVAARLKCGCGDRSRPNFPAASPGLCSLF